MLGKLLFRLKSRVRNTLYHIKVADWKRLHYYNQLLTGQEGPLPYLSLFLCSWRHGASFSDYYEFGMFRQTTEERARWLTISLRHELTRQVNCDVAAIILKNKLRFAEHFHEFLGREVFSYQDLKDQVGKSLTPDKLVIKPIMGQAGQDIHFPEGLTSFQDIITYMDETFQDPSMYMVEEFITQHPKLTRLNPSSVNTMRIMIYYDEQNDDVQIWGSFFRLGVDSKVDNWSGGGIIAPVDDRGTVSGPAKRVKFLEKDHTVHPITREPILGFQIPYYEQAIAMVSDAARKIPKVKSIGWDVAIMDSGPCLVEGNDNWGVGDVFEDIRERASEVCDMQMVYD